MAGGTLLSKQALRNVLNQWHSGPDATHPPPFPGPYETREVLNMWLSDIRRKAEITWELHPLQWANAAISWIPEVVQVEGERIKEGFRDRVLKRMREKKAGGELEDGWFWRWSNFKYEVLKLSGSEVMRRRLNLAVKTAGVVAATAGSVMLLPVVGTAVLGAAGFTTSGVAGGSLAASMQSMFFGGATGGWFSVLQAAGARAVAPAAIELIAGIGLAGAGAAVAVGLEGEEVAQNQVDRVGDIGDDRT